MLTYLKEMGIKMGIISNGGGEHQWAKIHTLGLTEWIPEANIMISGEVGAAKPDAKIFDFARWKMKIPRDDAWYIGDTFENDIVGKYVKRFLLAGNLDNAVDKHDSSDSPYLSLEYLQNNGF